MVAGTPVMDGVTGTLTMMLVVAGLAHRPAFGVKVRVTLPLSPAGSKLLLETPFPDHVPATPLCVVGKLMAASFWQMEAGTPVMLGVTAVFTVIVVVAGLAHWPAFGVKVRVTLPFCAVGLKLLPETPLPDQFPVKPPCGVGRLMEDALSQMEAGTPVIAGVTAVFTVMVVFAGSTQVALEVKVKLTTPLCPTGLKLEPVTPGPDQVPVG